MATYYWVGGTGVWDGTSTSNWSATSGGAPGSGPPISSDTVIFDSNSGTGTCTTASGSACAIATLNSATLGLTLGANHTMSGLFTLTAGTLSLASYVLSIGTFSSNNSNARSLSFGTGRIDVTGFVANIWLAQTVTNLTVSGSRTVRCTYAGASSPRNVFHATTSGGSANTALDFYVTAGTDDTDIGGHIRTLDFTGYAGTHANRTKTIYGDLIFSSGMTLSAGANAINMLADTGVQKLTTSGKTLNFPLVLINGPTASVQLQDDCTFGATQTVTLVSGILDLFGKTLTLGTFSSSNSNVRSIAFGANGALIAAAAGTAFSAATGTNLTTSGTGTISLTSASSKTFAGGGRSYPTLNQGGSGALTVSGSNTFASMTNTVQPATISLTAGTTTTVTTFTVSGTAGNLITLNSTSAGNHATLTDSGGVNSVSYVDIKDIAATGYGEWQAYTSNGNVDSGNNVGWVFAAPPPLTASEYQISLKSFTERRSF